MANKPMELLDPEAQKLFNKFKGLDTKLLVFSDSNFREEQRQQDQHRLILIDLAYMLGSYLKNARFLEGVKSKEGFMRKAQMEFASVFHKLSQIPSYDGSVMIRFRGAPPGLGASAGIDYVVQCGKIEVDCSMTAGIFSRTGSSVSHLSARLSKSFEVFSDHAVNNFYLKIPTNSREELDNIIVCLNIISSFGLAQRSDTPIVYEMKGIRYTLPPIKDDTGKHDPNLTLTAGINRIKPEMMHDMVRKVAQWMKQNDPAGVRFINVYNTIFEIKNLQDKLIRPPLEMNNTRWMLYGFQDIPPSPEKLKLSKIALKYSASPQEQMLMLNSIYGNDYHKLNAGSVGERFGRINQIMNKIEKSGEDVEAQAEMLANIESRLSQVRDEVFDEISIEDNAVRFGSGETQTSLKQVNNKLLDVLMSSKKQFESKSKMKGIAIRGEIFNRQDYQFLAKHFDIPVDDAKDLVELLKSCFDANGRFRRLVFEKNIPVFAWYEDKIFEFMWYYLKYIPVRNDRVAFLNAFKLLIDQVKQPLQAALVLIGDFIKDPFAVILSDRNAIMLTNQLMRSYNKELKLDIELTPEEVIMVKAGINPDVLSGVSEFIDSEHQRFLEKIRTIRKNMLAAVNTDKVPAPQTISFRYLLFLEREIYIFLAILGGSISLAVIRNALKYYGDPKSPLRSVQNSEKYTLLLQQQLRVVIRAIGRIGDRTDLQILDDLAHQIEGSVHFIRNAAVAEAGRQLLKWIEKSRKSILEQEWSS